MPTKQRIDIIERAAANQRAQHLDHGTSDMPTIAPIERMCDNLKLRLQICPGRGVMLGGAYSRLQLWVWEDPDVGGIIWLSADLDPELRRFAIAHELGHYVLHRGEGIRNYAPCDERSVDQQADAAALRSEDRVVEEYSPRVRREQEANAFAAELLAPRAEVRRVFTSGSAIGTAQLAAHFGISPLLARRRLIDAVLAPPRPADEPEESAQDATSDKDARPMPAELIARLDEGQRTAARAAGPALVVAGPGTGKTATLVGRVAHLVEERHIPPEKLLALTFSNRAAGEMRERLERSGLPGERMPIMTIHAFAATLLREYASHVPHAPDEAELTADFRILDEANAYLLMEGLLGELPLHYYRSLGNPTGRLRTLLDDFSHARDELLTPTDYLALVDAMQRMPAPDEVAAIESPGSAKNGHGQKVQPPQGTFTDEQIARARERAAAYAVWDRALRRRGLVDFGGLIHRAVELLRANPTVLADVRKRYSQILVDEFQDTNRAAAELLMLIADNGSGLWVVGDQNQSIYRFRGASPRNIPRLAERYPTLRVLRLQRCYRAVPGIVRLGSAMAAQMAQLAPVSSSPTPAPATGALHEALQPLDLEPVRDVGTTPPILHGETFASAAHERVGLAAAIERFHADGYRFGDQAILCRTHKQARQIAAVLTRRGVPVSQLGDFFERPEVKDALMLLTLAAGPDARGVLRATPLLVALGCPAPAGNELAATARYLSTQRHTLPGALQNGHLLSQVPSLAPATRAGLIRLGEIATALQNSRAVGLKLADFLLRPGGYTWRLARVADGQDAHRSLGVLPGLETAGQAQQALAALGELVRLAWRFDARWLAEPEFRARLSRAVRHRRAARPAQPDTLTPAPNADVMPMPPAAPASVPTLAHTDEDASVVTCFLHYLHALRATDVTVPVPAGNEDAVNILTLHQSKGLEFPVVLLPNLAHGQFPAGRHGREEVSPPGFRDGDTPGERDAEERCLFYVGVTRARDIVAFSRAASYGKSRTVERSALLALMDGAPDWAAAESLHTDEECERLLAIAATFEETSDDEDDSESGRPVEAAPAQSPREKPVFRLHDLNQYLECPLQYKYMRIHGFRDPARDAVYSFHAYIRRGAQELRDVQAASPQADWQAAEARLQSLWDEIGPAGHAYEDFYRQAAAAILREEWRAITSPEQAAASERVRLAQPLWAELKQCVVEVTADREIDARLASGESAAPLTVLVRLHTGRPRDDHKDDLTLPLYYLAYHRQHPDIPVRIVLAYTGGTLDDIAADSAESADPTGSYDPRHQHDVTDEARKVAERYLDANRKSRSKLDKLDEAAMGIVAGAFAPRPEERRCAACAYCYVCPSDPESVDPSSIPAATTT
ncbi:MAG TPA: ATP-dependent helicase [Ktedonobacterales bacterium]|nr:ATP-dependent helicase [Ktedonobacterales bacterium]